MILHLENRKIIDGKEDDVKKDDIVRIKLTNDRVMPLAIFVSFTEPFFCTIRQKRSIQPVPIPMEFIRTIEVVSPYEVYDYFVKKMEKDKIAIIDMHLELAKRDVYQKLSEESLSISEA